MREVLEREFADYESFHRTPGNRSCHALGIPLIVLAILGMAAKITLARGIDLGVVLLAVLSPWYLRRDLRGGIAYLATLVLVYLAARHVSLPVSGDLFVVGWIFQGVGHARYEHRSPAFFSQARHILIGPFWVFDELTGWVSRPGHSGPTP